MSERNAIVKYMMRRISEKDWDRSAWAVDVIRMLISEILGGEHMPMNDGGDEKEIMFRVTTRVVVELGGGLSRVLSIAPNGIDPDELQALLRHVYNLGVDEGNMNGDTPGR